MKNFKLFASLLIALIVPMLIKKQIGILESITFLVGVALIISNVIMIITIYNKKIKIILEGNNNGSVGSVIGLFLIKLIVLSGVLFTTIVVFHAPGLFLFLGSLVGLVLILLNLERLIKPSQTKVVAA